MIFLLLACAEPEPAPGPTYALVLILDGVRVEEFTSDWASDLTGVSGEDYADAVWDRIAPRSAVVRTAYNSGLTITAPSHAAIFSGHTQAFANFPVEAAGPGLYRPEMPGIFDMLKAADEESSLIANTELLMALSDSISPTSVGGATYELLMEDGDPDNPATTDMPVIDAIKAQINAGPPRLIVANLHAADRMGHIGGDQAYPNYVAAQDQLLGDFYLWLQTQHPEYFQSLLLVVTADHGRHRHDQQDGWHNHGDACTGCREVPLLISGPVVAGSEHTGMFTLLDLAPTVAGWLGVDLPWGRGLPMTELVALPETPVRTGMTGVAVAGPRTGVEVWLDDRDHRSAVTVDGATISAPDAFAAEGPALASGQRDYVCLRELFLATASDDWPWQARCMVDEGAGWTDIGFPDLLVSAYDRPALLEHDGVLGAAWPHNPTGSSEGGENGEIGMRLGKWTPETGWTRLEVSTLYPTDHVIAAFDEGFVIASGTSLELPESRYTRRVKVWKEAGDTLAEIGDFDLSTILGEPRRVERPALTAAGSQIRLGLLGMDSVQRVVAVYISEDSGTTWSEPMLLPMAGPPLPHLSPQWMGDTLVWAAMAEDGTTELCRAAPGDAAPACIPAGARVDSFAVLGETVLASVDVGVGQWELIELGW